MIRFLCSVSCFVLCFDFHALLCPFSVSLCSSCFPLVECLSPSVCQCYLCSVPSSLSSLAPRPLVSVFCVFKPLFPMYSLSVRYWCLCDCVFVSPSSSLCFRLCLQSPVLDFDFCFFSMSVLNFAVDLYFALFVCTLFDCFICYFVFWSLVPFSFVHSVFVPPFPAS